ncbi:MAG: 7-carboxy-7-deazaguanine synthase QueE [bacterium]
MQEAAKESGSRLKITEIFYSLQGESRSVGWPTVFIRLTGCPLRCSYCDTTYSFTGGEWMFLDDILQQVESYGTSHVTVTGGEPLSQKSCLPLLVRLCDAGFNVSLETSGALDVSAVDPRVVKVMDLKTPSSGEEDKNLLSNLEHLAPKDQLKFVIANREDYLWSREQLKAFEIARRCEVLFSPVHGDMPPRSLAEWVLEDRLPVRFQLQLHKYLWGDEAGR